MQTALVARLRDGHSEASTGLKALLRLHSKVRVRSQLQTLEAAATLLVTARDYTRRFAAAILAALLQLYLLLRCG